MWLGVEESNPRGLVHSQPPEPLGYGHTYTVTVASQGPSGVPATQTLEFTTLVPPNQTKVTFTSPSEAPLRDGGTYEVDGPR